jgi:hypothetical protein
MRLAARARLAALFCGAALLFPSAARADRTDFLIERLQSRKPPSDDPRVRGTAALALGGTGDDRAVQPLCGALDDESDFVRSSAAVALKKLGKSGAGACLKSHLGREKVESVKLQISRAVEAVGEGGGSAAPSDEPPPKLNPKAKYYISLSPVTNNTKRPQSDIDRIVVGAIRQHLENNGDFQLAPKSETPAAARSVMAARKMKGFYLSISVEPFDYAGGVRARVKFVVWRYPEKNMKGELSKGAGMPGGRQGDKGTEDSVLEAAAGSAFDQFATAISAFE